MRRRLARAGEEYLPHGWLDALRQLLMFVVAYAGYEIVRGLVGLTGYKPFRDATATAHLPGWPAPPGRQLAESVAKYVVVDMFAKACSGSSTKDVIKAADAQLRDIYRAA